MRNKIYLVALVALLFVTCKPANNKQNSTELTEVHEEYEDESSQLITAYSANYELFAEAKALELGKQADLLIHLSRLSDFKPLLATEVQVILTIAGKETTGTASKKRDGIYSCQLNVNAAGDGTLSVLVQEGGLPAEAVVANITVQHEDDHSGEESASTNGIYFTKEQQWKIDFATAMPVKEQFGVVIKTTGIVQSDPRDEVLITAKTNGLVSFGSVLSEGAKIQKGQVVLSIIGNELSENNSAIRYAEAKNNYDLAAKNYERLKILAGEKVVAEKELLEAENIWRNAKVTFEALDEQFNVNGQQVKCSQSGYVKALMVQNGQYVEAGTALFSIFKNEKLQIVADVSPRYLTNLQEITSVNIEVPGTDIVLSLDQLKGNVLTTGKATNTSNYLVPVTLQIEQNPMLIAGSFVQVYLKTTGSRPIVTIPNSALLEEQGNFYVFRQIHPELFEKCQVRTGATDGMRTEILAGIDNDARVIIKGAVLVKLSTSTGTLDAHSGHVH